MKKLLAVVLGLAMAASVFTACGGGTTSGSAEGTPRTDVIINMGAEPTQLNPILATDTGSGFVNRQILSPLFRRGQDGAIQGVLAESWTADEDNMGYTVKIRQDAKWSNGDPVTANDFIFGWTTLFTAATGSNYASTWATYIEGATDYLNGVEGAKLGFEAVDDHTIHVRQAVPCTYFLEVLGFGNLMPVNEKFYNEVGADKYASEVEYIVSCGPYKVESWTHEAEVVLVKDENYWDAANVKIEKAVLKIISDENASLNSFRNGEIDCHYTALSTTATEGLAADGYTVSTYVDNGLWYVQMNLAKGPLANVNLRKAISAAIDCDTLCTTIIGNASTAPTGLTPPTIPGVQKEYFHDVVGDTMIGFDAAKAKEYLATALTELGLAAPGDITLELIANDTEIYTNISAYIQEQLKTNLGININITQMTPKNRIQHLQEENFEMLLAGWSPDYLDAMTFLDMWTSDSENNNSNYNNAKYDELIAKAKMETDPVVRENYMVDAEKIIIADDCVFSPYRWSATAWVYDANLQGVVRNGNYGVFIADWSWAA